MSVAQQTSNGLADAVDFDRVERAETPRSGPAESGLWVVVILDLLVFTSFFVTYLMFLRDDTAGFTAAQAKLTVGFALFNTVVLVLSSLAVAGAVHAARCADSHAARRLISIAMLLGTAFIVSKSIEWGIKIDHDLVPKTNDFFMLYYGMTGLHVLHVFIGLAVLLFIRRIPSDEPFVGNRQMLFESGAGFWHLVDMLWLLLFPIIYFVH